MRKNFTPGHVARKAQALIALGKTYRQLAQACDISITDAVNLCRLKNTPSGEVAQKLCTYYQQHENDPVNWETRPQVADILNYHPPLAYDNINIQQSFNIHLDMTGERHQMIVKAYELAENFPPEEWPITPRNLAKYVQLKKQWISQHDLQECYFFTERILNDPTFIARAEPRAA